MIDFKKPIYAVLAEKFDPLIKAACRAGKRAMSMAQLPVISFAAYAGGNKAARLALAEEIDAAARDAGFFYLTNHGIDPTIIEAAFAAAETFFDLPEADKAAIAIANSSCHRGWFATGKKRWMRLIIRKAIIRKA